MTPSVTVAEARPSLAVRIAGMEADKYPHDAHDQGGSGLGSRQRRRRDREKERATNGGSQWQPQHNVDPGSYAGGSSGHFGSRVDKGGVGGGHREPNNGHSYSGSHRGRGRQNWHGGDWNTHQPMPASPPWPSQDEDKHSLKDLLMQVAPQARIVENTSRLSSKASANILSKVLTEANNKSSAEWNGKPDYGVYGQSSSSDAHAARSQLQEDDEEMAFMERWSGLFSKGSPLVEGNLEDPFEDVKKRTKVVWKKNNERKGHRTRNKLRRMQKEKDDMDDPNGGYDDDEAPASVVYDASQTQWYPQRPPAGM